MNDVCTHHWEQARNEIHGNGFWCAICGEFIAPDPALAFALDVLKWAEALEVNGIKTWHLEAARAVVAKAQPKDKK